MKYHNHTLQTMTRPDIIVHFIKKRNLFNFERKLYAQNVCPFQYLLSLMLSYSAWAVLLPVVLRRHTTSGKFHPTYGLCGIRCSFQCMQ